MLEQLLRRIEEAALALDLGISASAFRSDFRRAANRALRETGGPILVSLLDESMLGRAADHLEAE